MRPQQLCEILKQTLDDRRLSRSERSALDRIFDHVEPTEQSLAHYRSIACDLARDSMSDPHAKAVIDWLEDVVKLLVKQSAAGGGSAVAETHFSPGEHCPRRIAGLFGSARRTVEICVFTITDDRISRAIREAHQRGVQVRIVTDDEKATDPGSDVERLEAAGIPVRVDRSADHMHHKFAVFDRKLLLTGSYNWTRSAATSNEDNFLITGDRRFVEPFSELFEKLWKTWE